MEKLQQGEKLEEIDGPIPDSLAGGYIYHNGGAGLENVSQTFRDYILSVVEERSEEVRKATKYYLC